MMTDVKRFRVWPLGAVVACWLALAWCNAAVAATQVDEPLGLYGGSYALLIGASDYTAGWPDLESIPAELDAVAEALTQRGFQVVKHINPDSDALEKAFEDFIDNYGLAPENRLLFLFAGHGHTRHEGRKGYLVPTDAPDPNKDDRGFVRKALSLNQIMSWARRIEARHALFLFDSCFSGTVFKTRELTGPPPVISELTQEPVRYFITAGKAGEVVPAQSVFTPTFVDAIRFGTADLNQDGFVTGTELGLHLRAEVPKFAPQTPQFGPILDYELSRGDFVFSVTQPRPLVATDTDQQPPAPVLFTGHLQINTDRAANIVVDGRAVGNAAPGTPLNLTDLAVGAYRIDATTDDGTSAGQTANVVRGQWTQIVIELGRAQGGSTQQSAGQPPRVLLAQPKTPEPDRIAAVMPPRQPPAATRPSANTGGDKSGAKTRKPKLDITVLAFGMPIDDGSARDHVVSEYSQRIADMIAAGIARKFGKSAAVSARAVDQSISFRVITDSDDGEYRRRLCAEFEVEKLITLHMDHQFLGVGMGYATWREPVLDTFDCGARTFYRKSYQVNEKWGEPSPFVTQLQASLNSYLQANPLLPGSDLQ